MIIGKPLNATDKRQLPAISQSMTALIQQHNSNQISPDVLGKLEQMVAALNVKNVPVANAIHTVRFCLHFFNLNDNKNNIYIFL